jgi:hypothetical protein
LPINKEREDEILEPFIPLAIFENALRNWWVIVIFIVAGGLLGWLANLANLPLYEAKAQFSISIDFVSTGPLSQYEEDLAINTAGNLFVSTEVLQHVVDQANQEGIKTSLADFQKQITFERQFSMWTLRVRDPNPLKAERLATIWSEFGESVLNQGYQHAIQADYLERYIQFQEYCIKNLGAREPSQELCNNAIFTEVQANLRDAGTALYNERQASRGLFSGLTLGPFNPVEVSSMPVAFDRNQYVFLGSLLGFLFAIVWIELVIPKLHLKRR